MRGLSTVMVAVMLLAGPGDAPAASAVRALVAGLDHVPVAVTDLDRAAARYRALGFALKPGRPHANGIRNQHVKFADGTELELITAPAATDALTRKYRRHLERGDGPAFLAFFAPGANGSPPGLAAESVPDYIFFGGRNHSPTDRPEHFAHANTARSLISVWLAGDLARERDLLRRLGATVRRGAAHVPERASADIATFEEGDVVLLPPSFQVVPGRPIAGITMRVGSVATARRIIEGASLSARVVQTDRGSSLFVGPDVAHGFWLELREER